MSAALHFEALYGCDEHTPFAYVLRVDACTILLDCGWNDAFDEAVLEPLKAIAPHVSAVLVSHADLEHIGALPIAFGKYGMRAPVYASMPTFNMGQMFLYDVAIAKMDEESFDKFTLDDVDLAFDSFHPLKYSQRFTLAEVGIDVTPFSAGRIVGGSVWKITKDMDDILYAVEYNHKKDRHLNPSVLETLVRPSVLITDSYNALRVQESRKQRDTELLKRVTGTIKKGGNVLIAVDAAGRVLELLLMLDQLWANKKLSYPLAFLSPVAYNVAEFAKSQLEWMGESVMKRFDEKRENPFALKNVFLCHSLEDVEGLGSPAVVLATSKSLECGFSRTLFAKWASKEANAIIFTERQRSDTVAGRVLAALEAGEPNPSFDLTLFWRVPLEGEELEEYWRERKQREDEERERLESEKLLYGDVVSDAPGADGAAAGGDALAESQESSGGAGASLADSMDVLQSLSNAFAGTSAGGGADAMQIDERDAPYFVGEKGEVTSYDLYVSTLPATFPPPPPSAANAAAAAAGKPARSPYVPLPVYPLIKTNVDDEWDSYGVALTEADLKMRTDAAMDDEDAMDQEAEEETIEVKETPCKYLSEDVNVVVRAKVLLIDFEGRSDGKSIRNILAHVAPRRVVLVHGSQEASQQLGKYCEESISTCNAVFVPKPGEVVDVSSDTAVLEIKINELLMQGLAWQEVGEYEVAYIDGRLNSQPLSLTSTSPDGDEMELGEVPQEEADGSLSTRGAVDLPVLEAVEEQKRKKHDGVFIGDLLLSELKKRLADAGYKVELSSGELVVNNGIVTITKKQNPESDTSLFKFDGVLCSEYYRIRSLLYGQFNVF